MAGPGPGQEPVTFEDVAVYLSRTEWEATEQWQRELYRGVMVANYELLTSLGYPGPKPDILYRLERREEPWVCTPQSPVRWDGPRSPPAGPPGDAVALRRMTPGCLPAWPAADGLRAPQAGAETPPRGGRCTQWRLRASRQLSKLRGVGGGSQPGTAAAGGGTVPTENRAGTTSWPGKEAAETGEREVEPNQIQNTALRLHPGVAKQNRNPGRQDCVWGDPKEEPQGPVEKRPCSSEEMRLYPGDEQQRIEALSEVVWKDHCYCARSSAQLWSGALALRLLRDHDYCGHGRDAAAALRDHEYCQLRRSGRPARPGAGRGAAPARRARAAARRLRRRRPRSHARRLLRKAKRILRRYRRFVRRRLRLPPGSSSTDCCGPAGAEAVCPGGAEGSPVEGICGASCPPVEQEPAAPQPQSEAGAPERPLEAPRGPAELLESMLALSAAVAEAQGAYGLVLRAVDRMLERACRALELGGQGKEGRPVIIHIDG